MCCECKLWINITAEDSAESSHVSLSHHSVLYFRTHIAVCVVQKSPSVSSHQQALCMQHFCIWGKALTQLPVHEMERRRNQQDGRLCVLHLLFSGTAQSHPVLLEVFASLVSLLYETAHHSECGMSVVPPVLSCTETEQRWNKPQTIVYII